MTITRRSRSRSLNACDRELVKSQERYQYLDAKHNLCMNKLQDNIEDVEKEKKYAMIQKRTHDQAISDLTARFSATNAKLKKEIRKLRETKNKKTPSPNIDQQQQMSIAKLLAQMQQQSQNTGKSPSRRKSRRN